MKATGYQYHDSHPNYSSVVKDDLGAIARKLIAKNKNCEKGNGTCEGASKKDNKPPAADKILTALNQLSEKLIGKVKLKKGKKVKPPYITSDLAKDYIYTP